jgi:hypothetical protein
MKKSTLFIASLAVVIAVPAFANPPCLEFGRIWNWKVVDNKTVIVEDDTHQKFKFGLMGYCPEIQFYRDTLGFESHGGTRLSCMTPGDDVIIHTAGIHQRCPISAIVPYTAEMEKAEKVTAQDTKEKDGSAH